MPNTMGSFGKGLTGVDALKAAMQRRGMDSSALDQVSGSSPMGESPVAPQLPTTNPQVGNVPTPPPQGITQPEGQQFKSAEMEIALKALKGVVDTENKVALSVLGMR